MTGLILLEIQYGGYINPFKLAVYILLILAWFPLLSWVYKDTQEVRTNKSFWTGLNFGIPAVAAILWLFIPFYVIGILLFVITIIAVLMVYVMHRNSLVSNFEKVMTLDHFKKIFSNDQKKVSKAVKGFSFITANGNDVETPTYKSQEFNGFQVAQNLIDDAQWKRASDITFLPSSEEYNIFYKIDGVTTKQDPISRDEVEYLIKFLKQVADIDVNERRKPQSGNFKIKKGHDKIEFKVNTAGSTAGEKLQISLLEEGDVMKIGELGLSTKQTEQLSKIKDSDGGIFIISGPAGSGVSSTFYACLRNHDPFINNINTIEKKEGKTLNNVTQIYYKLSDTGTSTYGKRLLSMFRTGPDIIGVSDCEDQETAGILVDSISKNKRVCYVTYPAPSVIQALAKWFKLVPNRNQAIDLLTGISCQRLVRMLCPECKEAYEPNKEVFRKFNLPADKIKFLYRKGETDYTKHGKPLLCKKCQGTGYVGRTGIFETVFLNEQLKNEIKKAKSLQEIANLFRRSKMLYLQEQAIRKVAEGITSIDEVIREFTPQKPVANKRTTDKK